MSLILSALLAGAGGAAIGGWLARRRAAAAKAAAAAEAAPEAPKKEEPEDADEKKAMAEIEAELPTRKDESEPKLEEEKPKKKTRKTKVVPGEKARLEGFVCQLGDVVTRETGEEAWLAGGAILSEDIPVAVLFAAPEAGHDLALYVRPHPRSCLFWLEPLNPKTVLVGGEPPSSVEQGGIRFNRARRLPLRAKRIGAGAPDIGDEVTVAEYASAGSERLLVLKSTNGSVHAYRGLELEEGTYEVIASGDTTL